MDEILTTQFSDEQITSLLKTADAKAVYKKVKEKLGKYFTYTKTISHLPLAQHIPLDTFVDFTFNPVQIKSTPSKQTYSSIIVTENYEIYKELLAKQIVIMHIHSPKAIEAVRDYDIVYVFDCPTYESHLEQLPQSVIIDQGELFLETKLKQVLSWSDVISQVQQPCIIQIPGAEKLIQQLNLILSLSIPITIFDSNKLAIQVSQVNERLAKKISSLSVAGSMIVQLLQQQTPKEIEELMLEELKQSQIPIELIHFGYPLRLNDTEVKKMIQEQTQSQAVLFAKRLQSNTQLLLQSSQLLIQLERLLLVCDLIQGLRQYMFDYQTSYAQISEELSITQSKNFFIANPQAISYQLSSTHPATLLTGANSGGKTTLLEHVIQLNILSKLGIPVSGEVQLPQYASIYYFAKNKGSTNKGAFETMLTQLSTIDTNGKILLLADEMEAVTEPSVAAKIMACTLSYFTAKNAHMIMATHLGGVLANHIPSHVRIDGIDAVGIDEHNKIIIDHNPKQNHLAKSTPELIVQKLAKTNQNSFFMHLSEALL